ncbi:MAG: hypothetical protein IKT54_02570 [Clostridia bacterium]|nr:hypothetical protein [Clostridia bacterium]
MTSFILSIMYGLAPAAILLFFICSLVAYISAKKKNKASPGTYTPEQITTRKIFLIVSSIILGVIVAIVVGFMALLATAVIFM